MVSASALTLSLAAVLGTDEISLPVMGVLAVNPLPPKEIELNTETVQKSTS